MSQPTTSTSDARSAAIWLSSSASKRAAASERRASAEEPAARVVAAEDRLAPPLSGDALEQLGLAIGRPELHVRLGHHQEVRLLERSPLRAGRRCRPRPEARSPPRRARSRSSATPSPTAPWSLGLTTAMTDSGAQAPLGSRPRPPSLRAATRSATATRSRGAARSGGAARSPRRRRFLRATARSRAAARAAPSIRRCRPARLRRVRLLIPSSQRRPRERRAKPASSLAHAWVRPFFDGHLPAVMAGLLGVSRTCSSRSTTLMASAR